MTRAHVAVMTVAAAVLCLTACSPAADDPADGPDSEWATAFSSCMTARGWHVEVEWDGGVTGEFAEADRDRYRFDTDECSTDKSSGDRRS